MTGGNAIRAALASAAALLLAGPVTAQQGNCRFGADIYFEFGTANISNAAQDTLDALGGRLVSCNAPLIVLVGHIDAAEARSNPRLGQTRAEALAKELRTRLRNVPVLTQDLGFSAPAKATPAGVREPLNRRVSIYIR